MSTIYATTYRKENTVTDDSYDNGDWHPTGWWPEILTIIIGGLITLAAVIAAAKIPFPEW